MNTLNRRRGGETKNQTYTINHATHEQPNWARQQAAPLNPELKGKFNKNIRKTVALIYEANKCIDQFKINEKFPGFHHL